VPALVILLLIAVWLGTMWLGFVFVFPVLFPVALAGAGLVALGFAYVTAWQTLGPVTAKGRSPVPVPDVAYRHYLLDQVWRDWWALASAVGPWTWRTARTALHRLTRTLLGGLWGFFAFPVWLALCAGIVLAVVPAALLAVLLSVVYGVLALVGMAGWLVCVAVLWLVERAFMAYGRILQTCPHPFCYEKIALPVYECPGCGTRHERLTPGRAGAFRHVCRCGVRLPTTIPLGRYRLTAYCPHCGGRLPERIGRVRVEPLPFVGGPAAGKTTFMFLAIRALHARARAARGRLAFVEKRHAQAYAGAVQEFQRGGRLAKTGPELPLATMVDVELPGRRHRILYLFDPAGEHFTGASEVESLRYLDHGEALLFVVDPFALPAVRRALSEDERELVDRAAASSEEDPADTLQRVLNELRSRPDRGRQRRVAVVLTKVDLLCRTTIGRSLADSRAASGGAVRGWLEEVGLGNAIRALDQLAGEVRYLGSGLDTPASEVAGLLGWVTGLPSNGQRGPVAEQSPEVPGTAPLRDPWPAVGRRSPLVPAGYQAGRWAVLAGLVVFGVTGTVAALGLAVGYAIGFAARTLPWV
jgi:double-GTPase-like protein